ncbi:MAG TPA: GNAT family N-acetyltransferase [Candidatus Acidoferrales bacterium]|nr:GNAT family N-acetyltransferase [Candidatus Acidoferrales bacterium]
MVRLLEPRDVRSILAIQSASPEIAQWTLRDYDRVARGEIEMAGWASEGEGGIRGFLVARHVVGDLEILNFAVSPASRRQGVGAALLAEALHWSKAFRPGKAILEVRASNLAALQFYEKHGFKPTGRRLQYYTAPIEDALVLALRLE